MRSRNFCALLILAIAVVILQLAPAIARADATIPTADIPGASDLSWLGRFTGSFIVDYNQQQYGELSIPVSALVRTDRTDSRNNHVYASPKQVDLEGRRIRIVYLMPPDRSSLEVLRNYEDAIKNAGGEVLFQCKQDACGGDPKSGSDAGGGSTGLLQILYPSDELKVPTYSNAYCAVAPSHSDQRYLAAKVNTPSGPANVGILVYSITDNLYCKAFNNRTIAVVSAMEPAARQQQMTAGNSNTPAAQAPSPQPPQSYSAPASAPTGNGPAGIEIPAGTQIIVRLIDAVNSDKDSLGQTYRVSIDQPVVVNGQTAIPRGADAVATLIDAQKSGKIAGRTVLTIDLKTITVNGRSYDIVTTGVPQASSSRGTRSAKVIGGAAGLGAVLGGIAGGGRGAAIGAGSGAAVGTAAQVITSGQKVKVPAETRLTFTLQNPLDL